MTEDTDSTSGRLTEAIGRLTRQLVRIEREMARSPKNTAAAIDAAVRRGMGRS